MWFTESPWVPFLVCLALSAVFFSRWVSDRRRGWLLAACGFLVASAAVVIVERLIVTESERVEGSIERLAKVFEAGDGDACAAFFSPHDERDRELVRQAAGMVKIDGPIRISDLSVDMNGPETRAVSRFRASADATYQGYHDRGRTRWEVTWEREGPDWKITRVRRLRLLGDEEIGPLTVQE
jgi:hypothetical protein